MISLIKEAAELQEFFESEGKEFFFVGGLALQIWGRPRLTTDIDCTIFTNLTDEDNQILALLNTFQSRFSDKQMALNHARIQRVLLLESRLGTGIDVLLSGLADTSEELARSSYQQFTKDISLRICSADSLIAFKTVAGRLQDYADIESILIKQSELDWEYIDQWLAYASEYKDLNENLTMLARMRKEFCRP
ncbi:MAG: nucleotidyl transferase AbiEii/AbiGii toxin family protein [Pyrinomonadaceae bacterium]